MVSKLIATALLFICSSVVTPALIHAADTPGAPPQPIVLREGDELKISFPGAPSLDTIQKIRSDGRITMSLVGEIVATGLTPTALQSELEKLYASQLVSKEVTVSLLSRSFFVYVNGGVLKKGRLDFDRPVTALEAIMAAGFEDRAVDLKKVSLTRIADGNVQNFTLNLDQWMHGKEGTMETLKQGDMIVVPSRLF